MNAERQVRSRGMPHVGQANSITNGGHGSRSDTSDKELLKPVTRVIKITLPKPSISFIYMIIHSSFFIRMFTHSSMHAFIHSSHASKASHMQINASQRFMLRHEAVVASFNMSNDRLGFEGRPTKGSRPPRVKRSQGRKHR